MGPRSNIPLATGIFPKVAESLVVPMSHLKGDHKELEGIKSNAKSLDHVAAMYVKGAKDISREPVQGLKTLGESTGLGRRIKNILKIVKSMEADDNNAKKTYARVK